MELKDKTAIVTGAGRGIGEGIALVLAREGAKIVAVARTLDDIKRVAEKIEAQGGKALAVSGDVTKKKDIDAVVAATLKQFGTIDILVNNAGTQPPPNQVHDLSEEQWDQILTLNLKGPFLCCRAVIPIMMGKKKGKIINISSQAGLRMSIFGSAEYTASKHGLIGFSHHLAWELAEHRINVNTICPGGVLTPLALEKSTPEIRDFTVKRFVPLGRWITPDEIGEAVAFLASERSNMITGQVLAVDGGLLTGFGEDVRPILNKRIADMKAAGARS
jgi:NAD(P)-dependent dehydrogenase (short-subunit alcohol dehydrogenase family)